MLYMPPSMCTRVNLTDIIYIVWWLYCAFSALTLFMGSRKGIRPVKNLSGGMLAWLCVCVKVQICIWPSWCHCHSLSLAPVNPALSVHAQPHSSAASLISHWTVQLLSLHSATQWQRLWWYSIKLFTASITSNGIGIYTWYQYQCRSEVSVSEVSVQSGIGLSLVNVNIHLVKAWNRVVEKYWPAPVVKGTGLIIRWAAMMTLPTMHHNGYHAATEEEGDQRTSGKEI